MRMKILKNTEFTVLTLGRFECDYARFGLNTSLSIRPWDWCLHGDNQLSICYPESRPSPRARHPSDETNKGESQHGDQSRSRRSKRESIHRGHRASDR